MKKSIFTTCLITFCLFFFFQFTAIPQNKANEITFISDTQEPTVIEKFQKLNENNTEATDSLFSDISKREPIALFMLGDIVTFGFMDNEWKKVEKRLEMLKNKNIPVFAVPGNHEYLVNAKAGIKNFTKYFHSKSTEGYFKIIDSIAIIMINSNFDKLKESKLKQELSWYNSTIDSLQGEKAIKMIIVCCHHSPFTNSTLVKSSVNVQKKLLPAFNRNSKAKLFLSGHSHNLEYFFKNNKNYIVLGGGGGAYHILKDFKNSLTGTISINNKPRFFYILVKRNGDELIVTARGITKDLGRFTEIEVARIK